MKILLIDDDEDLLEITARRFTKKGCEVQTALNLTDAKALLKAHPIKGIVCDLFLLDGENGINFFESHIKDKFNGKFALVTGDDSADSRIETYKQSYANFTCFQKPYSIEDVIVFLQ